MAKTSKTKNKKTSSSSFLAAQLRGLDRSAALSIILRSALLIAGVALCTPVINRRTAAARQEGCTKGVDAAITVITGGQVGDPGKIATFCTETLSQ